MLFTQLITRNRVIRIIIRFSVVVEKTLISWIQQCFNFVNLLLLTTFCSSDSHVSYWIDSNLFFKFDSRLQPNLRNLVLFTWLFFSIYYIVSHYIRTRWEWPEKLMSFGLVNVKVLLKLTVHLKSCTQCPRNDLASQIGTNRARVEG